MDKKDILKSVYNDFFGVNAKISKETEELNNLVNEKLNAG